MRRNRAKKPIIAESVPEVRPAICGIQDSHSVRAFYGTSFLDRAIFKAAMVTAMLRVVALVGMGGTGGTTVVTAAMRALPVGVPKVCVSTAASGDVSAYIGAKDITMIPF